MLLMVDFVWQLPACLVGPAMLAALAEHAEDRVLVDLHLVSSSVGPMQGQG